MAPSRYSPQVDDSASYVEGPPPAYTKGYSVKLQLFRLVARTVVCLIALIGAFVLLAAYIRSTSLSCTCPDEIISRIDSDPLIAEPSTKSDFKLHIGEDVRKAKDKRHLNCLVEKNEQVLDAVPPRGEGKLQVKDQQTVISCSTEPGKKRIKRSAPCECQCAC